MVWVKLLEHFLSFFHIVNLVIFHPQYVGNGYLLWAQLLLQFCTDQFETLHMFSSWYEGVHVVWVKFLEHFLSLFPHCELSHFSPSIYRQWVPLMSATPLTVLYRSIWNFAYVFFMVWGCACGLGIIVRSFFVTFFTLWTWSFFTLYTKTVGTSCECSSSYSFVPIIMKLCMCFFHGMRMCMWFGYNC